LRRWASKSVVPVRVPRVRIPCSPPEKQGRSSAAPAGREAGEGSAICTAICSPLDEATLKAAIDRVTRALATANDDAIIELVAERRAMRVELGALQREIAGNVIDFDGRRRDR
jgi:hypothetical protein